MSLTETVRETSPLTPPPAWQRALDRAEKQIARGSYTQAISSLERAIAVGADGYTCILRIADVYRTLRQWPDVFAAAEQAIALAPARTAAYEILMEVALEAGDRDRAMSASMALIKLAPRHIPAYNTLGTAYLQVGNVEAAMRIAKTLIRLDPEAPTHHFKMALLCQHQGEVALAVHEFMQTIRLAPESALAEAARDALETLDIFQLNQIVTLALEDAVFRAKLSRDPVEAAIERGYALSAAGDHLLTEFCSDTLPEFPPSPRTLRYN
ncbi:MAG TPA: tetratricopeptide repeat protein [Chthonomonadaceae bacterium]|nr:tetratricopeptide repeat protein [Chthonomonadaceae bacterium]